jgi:nicotinamidase-related amidase
VNVSDFPIVASICHSATARWAAVALSSSVYVLGEVTSSRVMKTSPVSIRG